MAVEFKGLNDTLKQIEELAKQLNELADHEVLVGIPESENKTTESGLTIAQIGAINEFGSAKNNIPARPFLRQTLSDNHAKYSEFYAKAVSKNDGETALDDLNKLAVMVAGDVKDNIRNGNWVENKPETIKRKGSSKPLIDTGRLRQSIKGIVVKKQG